MRARGRLRPILALFAGCVFVLAGCDVQTSRRRAAEVGRAEDRPERYLPAGLAHRADSALLLNPRGTFDTDDEAQSDSLLPLPPLMTVAMIQDGDALFHGTGGCDNCHGSEGQGLAARGKSLTAGVQYIPAGDWSAMDSVIAVGIPESETRSPISMPPRGQHSDLSEDEIARIGAYVWAISQTRGEPWQGGHRIHAAHDPNASARTDIP